MLDESISSEQQREMKYELLPEMILMGEFFCSPFSEFPSLLQHIKPTGENGYPFDAPLNLFSAFK
jgi:hypothetical protein